MAQHISILILLLLLNIINEARLDSTYIYYSDSPEEKIDKTNTKLFCKNARYFLIPWTLFQILLTIMQIQ